VPILDHNIVEFAFSIPPRLKLKGTNGKYVFKKAMAGLLPKQIINRRKRGYNAPMDYWFKHSLRNTLEQLLYESKHDYYNKEYVLDLLNSFQGAGKNYNLNFPNAQKLWSILVFEMWHRLFIENRRI
jgi:asparagine synthase (glutamine-hydrolysing)